MHEHTLRIPQTHFLNNFSVNLNDGKKDYGNLAKPLLRFSWHEKTQE